MSTSKFFKRSIGIIILFSGNTLLAQDTLQLSVEQAIATALQNNYDIQISRNDSLVAAINYAYRNAALFPTLNAAGTKLFNNNSQSQTYENGTVRSRSGILSKNFNYGLNASWILFNGFKMFIARNGLSNYLEQGSFTIQNQISTTVSEVIKTYYDIVHQKQLLRNIQEQMTSSSTRLQLAKYKFDIGVGIKPDVLQAQVDLNLQKAAAVNQRAIINQRKQDLNQLMNVPQNLNYDVSDTIPVDNSLLLADILSSINQSNPQLLLSRKNIDVAKVNVRLAKADHFPTLTLVSAYNFARTNNSTVVNPLFQPLLNVNQGFNYGLTISVPIFNNYKIRQQIKQAELAVTYQQLLYQNQQSTVNRDVLKAYQSYIAQQQIVAISDSSVMYARENLFIEKERYRIGNVTFIELRTAEQSVADAETTRITARYNLKIAETDLLRLKGALVRRQ